jgi:hypothetical protein
MAEITNLALSLNTRRASSDDGDVWRSKSELAGTLIATVDLKPKVVDDHRFFF